MTARPVRRYLDHEETDMQRRELLMGMAGLGLSTLPGAGHAAEDAAIPTIPGPDPHTRTPTFKPPAGSVDTHTHIFGPADLPLFAEAALFPAGCAARTVSQGA
jgi:hypothetical protein